MVKLLERYKVLFLYIPEKIEYLDKNKETLSAFKLSNSTFS